MIKKKFKLRVAAQMYSPCYAIEYSYHYLIPNYTTIHNCIDVGWEAAWQTRLFYNFE